MQNFEFEHNGQKLWYSRSLAVALYLFTRDPHGKLYILANKRGQGCEFNKGLWNVPGGFIDFGENALQCAERECHEETGFVINLRDRNSPIYATPTLYKLDTEPHGRQTMVAVYTAFISWNDVLNQVTTNEFCEPGEVEQTGWLDMSEVYSRVWTRDQLKTISQIRSDFYGDD